MKPGDKVKCVDAAGDANGILAPGGIYTVRSFDSAHGRKLWLFEQDNPISGYWWAGRFELTPEPSKEALDIAKCLGLDADQIHSVAWELQRLMDECRELEAGQLKIQERAEAAEKERDFEANHRHLWVQRADAAEKEAKRWEAHARSLEAPLQDWRQRAEAAEKDAADHGHWCAANIRRAQAAEARLAECVRRVRERYRTPGLLAILDEYEAPK